MTWRDSLRPASFRGVPFYVSELGDEPGRRVEVIRLPGREDVIPQEMGTDARDGSVTAFVVGADYIAGRDALEAALLTPGPGILVHPTRGEMSVVTHGKFKWNENPTAKGGFASVSFAYTVATPQAVRSPSANGAAALTSVSDAAIGISHDGFVGAFSIEGLSSGAVSTQISAVQRMSAGLSAANSTISSIVADVSAVVAIVNHIENQTEALLAAPAELADAFGEAFARMIEDAADLITAPARIGSKDFDATTIGLRKKIIRTIERAVEQILAVDVGVELDRSTPTRQRETANLIALNALYRATVIETFCRTAPDMPWTSYQEAARTRELVATWLETVEADVDDNVYQQLQDVRVSLALWLDSVALSLPMLRAIRVPEATCAILLAHQLYGDASRESELVGRNDLANPAFIPPTRTLEVARA